MKVDSVLLSIPVDECKLLHPDLKDSFKYQKINTNTGEIHDIKNHKGIKHEITKDETKDGTSFHFGLNKQWYYPKDSSKEERIYLSFLCNSKHLKSLYFKGITRETYKVFYENIMQLKVFNTSYETFKKARYSDIDICFDFPCKIDDFSSVIENFKNSFLEEKMIYFHSVFNTKNAGFWTPTRKNPRFQADVKKPFMKAYHKETELIYKSNVFAKKYLNYQDFKDLARMEFQVKNSDHKRSLGLTNKQTFWNFLNSDLKIIASKIAKRYTEKAKFKKDTNMKPNDKVILDLIRLSLDHGALPSSIRQIFDRTDVNRMAKSRLLEKYQDLYSKNDLNAIIEAKNETSSNIFDYLDIKNKGTS